MKAADPATIVANATSAQPGAVVANRILAIAGPTSRVRLSSHPETTFAAVSCAGVSTRAGSKAAWAGWVSVTADVRTTAPA